MNLKGLMFKKQAILLIEDRRILFVQYVGLKKKSVLFHSRSFDIEENSNNIIGRVYTICNVM
jgi:hypothetical protein